LTKSIKINILIKLKKQKMILKEEYHFKPTDYDSNGFNKIKSEFLFSDFIHECEKDFKKKHHPYFANIFSANGSTLHLLKSCFNGEDNEIFGMVSTDGDVDLEMNFKIEQYSENRTVYAIGSHVADDEPVFLIEDNDYYDNEFSLKFIPDVDEETILEDLPDGQTKVKVLTKC